MNRLLSFVLLFTFACGLPCSVHAQQSRKSPHDTISRKVEGNRITIIYGRPFTRDPSSGQPRKIWGGLVPYDKIWRLGADEATTLITQQTIDLGGLEVPAGTYTLFMLPAADGTAKLIVNKEIGQWGIDPYHADRELGRIVLKAEPLATPVPQLTIALENGRPRGGVIKISWEDTQFTVPYTVKK